LGLDLRTDARRHGENRGPHPQAVIEAKIALSSQPTAKLDVDLPAGENIGAKFRSKVSGR